MGYKLTHIILRSGWLIATIILISGCSEDNGISIDQMQTVEPKTTSSINGGTGFSQNGLTDDFRQWLQQNGYGGFDFARDDLVGGSFGGRTNANDPVQNQPVIFIHGNADRAIGQDDDLSGWVASRDYFLSKGYTSAELYATTWGPADVSQAANQVHSKAYLTKLRAFVEAVLAYTGSSKVDIISHSMGVTLGRKVVKGGRAYDPSDGGYFNLGTSLTDKVDAFVGIAGGNWGLTNCYLTPTVSTCNDTNGFYPGYYYGPLGLSDYLRDLNATSGYEGQYVYTIWSSADQVIGYGTVVWGKYTCRIPGQHGEKKYSSFPYGHFNVKDLTGYYQWRMVKDHKTY